MRAHFHRIPVLVALWAVADIAAAQGTRIDPGHSDVSPGSVSLRRLDIDQRVPTGFDSVYQLSQADAFGRGQNLFMRIDGAVTAVFPRSVYVPAGRGLMPDIPPGTTFYIGALPGAMPPPGRTGRFSPNFIDTAVRPGQEAQMLAAWSSLPPARTVQSLITDEGYRCRRIAALLNRMPAAR